MKKIIFSLLLLSSFLFAGDTYVHNISLLGYKNKCIYNNYYLNDGYFYYEYVDDNSTHKTSSKSYVSTIIEGYQFDVNTSICSPEPWVQLGITTQSYHFLNALIGLLFGFVFMIFTIYLFIKVGSKK